MELVFDLTTDAFVAALRRFVARRGCPTLIWSDHGSNFVGAKRELKALQDSQKTQGVINSSHSIQWKYIPERSPWESAVKSTKAHLKRVVSTTKLTQIEACLNSRPLVPVNSLDDDGL